MKTKECVCKCCIPIILLSVAFAIRILWMGDFFGQDEVYYVGYAKDLVTGRSFTSVFPPFFYYSLAPIVYLFGDSEFVIHILMAVLGTVNIALVYYIGKKFFNVWIAVIAALLLTFNTTHWFFSDFAMLDVPVTLLVTAAILLYWSGYKDKNYRRGNLLLLAAALVSSAGALTKYGFLPAVAMGGYLLLFDRRRLKDLRMLFALGLPVIVFGIWMTYFVFGMTWLWNWWYSYLTGSLSINLPFYYYLLWTYDEFLLPIPALFVIFTTAFLISKKIVEAKIKKSSGFLAIFKKHGRYIFLAALALAVYYFTFSTRYLDFQTRAVVGFISLALPCLYFFKGNNFNKFLIFSIILFFGFYSLLGVKFARYVMPALPAFYLLVGQAIYEVRKYKLFVLAAIIILTIFIVFNSFDTIGKLLNDNMINNVKHEAQQYINDNSKPCSRVYSKTWYGFYYLRTRIVDLPTRESLLVDIRSHCDCPPKYVVSEGFLEGLQNEVEKEKDFKGSVTLKRIDFFSGITDETIMTTPVVAFKIKDDVIASQCKK